MKFTIREAVPADYDSLCTLFDEGDALHRVHLPGIFQKPEGAVRERDYVLGLIKDQGIGFFVAHIRAQLLGMICVVIRESSEIPVFLRRRYAVVDNVVVRREYRRRGIGRALMCKAHEWAAAEGAESIELNVWEFNQEAYEFYITLGYETASRKMSRRLR